MLIETKLAIQDKTQVFWQGEVSTLVLLRIIDGVKDFSRI